MICCSSWLSGLYQKTLSSSLIDTMLSLQVQFVDSVLGSGLLLYLSPTWLSELYQQTVTSSLMDVTHLSMADCSLLQMLEGWRLWYFGSLHSLQQNIVIWNRIRPRGLAKKGWGQDLGRVIYHVLACMPVDNMPLTKRSVGTYLETAAAVVSARWANVNWSRQKEWN